MTPQKIARLAFVLVLSSCLHAQNAPQAQESSATCDAATTTAAMRACENDRYETARQEMETAYHSLLTQLREPRKKKLMVAQRAWLRFRDANADFQASAAEGGTLAPLVKISALEAMTTARAAELKRQSAP